MHYNPPTFLAAKKTELSSDNGAIYVDRVMNQRVELSGSSLVFALHLT